jgi:alpha-L-glutamate ligase-like protein
VTTFGRLHAAGVLGINRRNSAFTLKWNPRRFYPLVDDKLQTKRLCEEAGIPVPAKLAVAAHHFQVRGLLDEIGGREDFVLKPVHGAMGNGIVVITGRDGDRLRRVSGKQMTTAEFRYHAAGIISGLYALGGQPDQALIEERLIAHPLFRDVSTDGVPDIRVVVFRGVPIMAMTRLPTAASAGRANLHQGAIGVAIDLVTGRTTFAAQHNRPCSRNPDSGRRVLGIDVPDFGSLLEIAVRATDRTQLGYVGADLVLDEQRGPVILELNARPGLAIQIANRAGLCPRLDAVERTWQEGRTVADRVALGRGIAREHPPLP